MAGLFTEDKQVQGLFLHVKYISNIYELCWSHKWKEGANMEIYQGIVVLFIFSFFCMDII